MSLVRPGRRMLLGALLVAAVGGAAAAAFDDFDEAPIRYASTAPTDAIAKLQRRIDRGEITLRREGERGYLASLLRHLGVPLSSQTLVFSKTSFQRERISPLTPRALYFNDEVYVGWVQGGPVVEVSAVDPQLGAVFYVLGQDGPGRPRFVRQTHECLSCHSSGLTGGVPGHVVRSVYPARDGQPILQAGTFITRDESPFTERWGGWYVTGTHGEMRHMGNLTAKDAEEANQLDRERGANLTDLRSLCSTRPYLTPHSDIVALMVLQHQTHVHNMIARASFETRKALHFEKLLNRDLGRPVGFRSESTESRIRSGTEPLVRALLFSEEAPLTGPIRGTSGFAREFVVLGPRDTRGRSLRQLDLRHRLFRYPCSFLIYSEAFEALPTEAKSYVFRRLREVLEGVDPSEPFQHLTSADRTALREILAETHPGFAAAGNSSP